MLQRSARRFDHLIKSGSITSSNHQAGSSPQAPPFCLKPLRHNGLHRMARHSL
jgi:hypothetical protein